MTSRGLVDGLVLTLVAAMIVLFGYRIMWRVKRKMIAAMKVNARPKTIPRVDIK